MNRFTRAAGAAQKVVADNSPTILTVAAVAGVLTTVYLVAKAAPKVHTDIINEQSERTDELDLTDKVLLTYKHYIPATVTGGITIACIIGANTINMKRTSALAGAVGLSELAFKSYRDKVVEHIGDKKEERIHDDVMQDVVTRNPVSDNQVIITGNGNALFLDNYSERYFDSDMESVRRAVNDINEQIFREDSASLNDFYNRIGIKGSKVGDDVGWTQTNKLEIRYSAALTDDGRPCVVLDYRKNPIGDYWKVG